jgi:hypothetical protein
VARGASKTLLFAVRADAVTGEMTATILGLDRAVSPGNLVDLTGVKVWFTAKNRVEDAGATIVKKNAAAGGVDNQVLVIIPQTGASVGLFKVIIDPADTSLLDPSASFWCDAFVQMPGGPPINRQQVSANRQLIVDPVVTTDF